MKEKPLRPCSAASSLFGRFLDDGVQGAEDPVPVLGLEHVLELVDHQEQRGAAVRGEAEREPQDGLHVLLVHVPIAGEDLVGVREGFGIEDEMGAAQIILDDAGVLRRGRGDHPDDGRAETGEELVHGADVQDGELAHGKGPLAIAHRVHRLLDEGVMLGDQVRKDRTFGFPADEILTGHEFVIREGSVHRPHVTILLQI